MGGGLFQLVAKGMQDIYIIGNPQITLFIAVYRRTSNFSMYDHTYDLKGCDFSKEFKLQFDYLGDLLHKLWLVVDIPEIILERTKATFDYIYLLLASYGIIWNYSPESKTSIVTLNNFNGGVATLTSEKIITETFHNNDTVLNLTIGQINLGRLNLKVISGNITLSTNITNNFNDPFVPNQSLLTENVNVVNGNVKISTNSIFGDVFPITSGTLTLNKQKIGSNYIYFVSDVVLNSEFTLTIMNSINSKITNLIETYNLYNTAHIITKNSDTIINKSVDIFNNLDPNILNDTPDFSASLIKNSLISGRNTFMQIIQTILSKYASNYSYDTNTYFFPKSNNNYIISNITESGLTRLAQLYSNDFKNAMINHGLLLGAIQNYSYDTTAYNANYKYQYITVVGNNNNGGKLFRSLNNGLNFSSVDISSTILNSMWISYDGIIQSVSDQSGNIYKSTNSGSSWYTHNICAFSIDKIAGSSNGQLQMCIASLGNTGYIYITTNYWVSYITTSIILLGSDRLVGITISSNGLSTTVVTRDGYVYTYDGNNSWIQKNQLSMVTNSVITGIGSSYNGALQTILSSTGRVYVSSNEWTSSVFNTITLVDTNILNIANVTTSLVVSDDGFRQTVGDSQGNIYLSSSSGSSWSNGYNISPHQIISLEMGTKNGQLQVAIDSIGKLYISNHYGTRWNYLFNVGTIGATVVSGCIVKEIIIPDSVEIKLDGFMSVPLFENTLIRPTSDVTNITKLKLYNSDDIRMLFYVTFINNILRQKIVLTQNETVPFNPLYTTTIKNTDISLSTSNLDVLDPDNTFLDDVLLFYHITDSRVTNYPVYKYDVDSNTDTYFDNNIETNYASYDKYNILMNGSRENYTKTDSYKVYKSFIKDVMSGDIVNKTIKSEQQVNLLATTLRYNIDLNIRYNFNQVLNNMTILINASRTNPKHFILSFYRQYTQSLDTYVSTSSISFIPIIDNTSISLADNFKNLLSTVIETRVPDGVAITNYFNNYINMQIKKFTTACQNLLKATNYDEYTNKFNMWTRVLPTSGSALLSLYNSVNKVYTDYPIIPATIFGRISLMNFIPLLAAKDIPVMLYNVFSKYGKQIMIDIGFDSETSQTNYDSFLSLIDFRDLDIFDRPKPLPTSIPADVIATKLEIYNRLILSLILVSTDGGTTQVVQNSDYFAELQLEKATGQISLLACSLRPESYFYPYSTQNQDGSLTDSSSNPLDMKALPIEWLTQTYYNIFKERIISFINGLIPDVLSVQNKTAKNILVGILGNVINCFILRSDIPVYKNYVNNNFSLLGLVPETNSSIKKYKKTKEDITISTPQYSDAISSIWYQTQKGFIQLYNGLYNDTLLSSKYYYENLGNVMGSIFDYIKEQILDDDNVYYSANENDYPESLPESLLDSFVNIHKSSFSTVPLANIDEPTDEVVTKILNYVGELYPAVDTKGSSSTSKNAGFNFFKLNVGDPTVTTSKAYKINTYVKDYSLLYDHLMNYYESHKNVTLIKNDIDTLNFSTPTTGIRRKNTFQYEMSSVLIDYLNDHITTTYINPVIDKTIRESMIELVNNTSTYWNPNVVVNGTFVEKNLTGVYGVLDAIYNTNFDGSISDTLSKISIIPNGKNIDDLIDFDKNPFTSYCLRLWYAGLNTSYSPLLSNSEFTYRDLTNITDLLTSKLYTMDGTTLVPLITTQFILKNKFIGKLYSDNNKSIFSCVDHVAWFLFDLVMSDDSLNSFVNIKPLLQTIQKTTSVKFDTSLFSNQTTQIVTDNGAIETLQQLLINHVLPNSKLSIEQFEKISKFKSSANTITYNDLNQYYDLSLSDNVDINYYQESLDGTPVINVPLEVRLFNLISGIKPKYAWTKELGHKILKKLSLSIGGQIIDSYTPELTHLIYNLTKSVDHERGYNILTGNTKEMYTYSNVQRPAMRLMLPFNFWFCKNAGNSLPLIKLLYTDVTLSGQISDIDELLYREPDTMFKRNPKLKCGIMGRYIYLDDDERSLMADTKMEYLIEKFNYNGCKIFSRNNLFSTGGSLIVDNNDTIDLENLKATAIVDIHVNDPIKYFVWYMKFRDKSTEQPIDILEWCNFGYNVRDSNLNKIFIKTVVESIELKMNGVTREIAHSEAHYTHLVPYDKKMGSLECGEYIYSFALYPLLLQPTGSANYSEIPNSSFVIKFTNQIEELFKTNPNLEVKIEVWGLAYNTFRCVSGMGGLVFNKP